MKVAVTVQHPAHVHFFRHAVESLRAGGHAVTVFAREKEVVVDLLEAYDLDHEVLAGPASSLVELAVVQCTYEARLLRRVRRFEPDVIVAVGGVAAAHVGALLDVPSVLFYDTEHASLVNRLAFPFADAVWTPESYRTDLGRKHWRYPGFHELAYLHPDRFEPDPAALEGLDVGPDDPYAVVRVGGWEASHDVGQGGFSDPREVVDAVERTGATALVSAESTLPADLERCRLTTPPDRIHHLLAFADAVVSEGATMAAESAVLGTPAVYVSTLSLGYLDALESRYGLLSVFDGPDRHQRAVTKTVELLEHDDPSTWQHRRARLLDETVDTTDVVLDAVSRAARRPVVA